MVKFTFYVSTPRGGHYNTHYARTSEVAENKVEQWGKEFAGTGYGVTLVSIVETNEKLPRGYNCW